MRKEEEKDEDAIFQDYSTSLRRRTRKNNDARYQRTFKCLPLHYIRIIMVKMLRRDNQSDVEEGNARLRRREACNKMITRF